MGKEQVDEKHEIKFFEIIYKLIEFVSALCLCGQVNGVDVFSHSQHGN